jgi:NADH-quinone oxidoreductase subunit L
MISILASLAFQEPHTAEGFGVAGWIGLTILFPFLGFLLNGTLAFLRPNAKGAVSALGVGTVAASFGVAVLAFAQLLGAPPHEAIIIPLWEWIPAGKMQIAFSLQVDQLSLVMLLIVTGVGSLIHVFSVGYMRADPAYARYFAYLNLFVAFMLVLVLGANLPTLFIGWEGVGLCSYLLIGFWYGDKVNADAGKKAFIVNRIGDFGALIAMFLIWQALGTLSFTEIGARAPEVLQVGGATVTAITLLLFLGCAGKSAQIPLYTWLPDAMAGPTPVSALIHAATMVTAGVYLVARTNVLFAMAPSSQMVVAGVGAATALFAATIGLRQYDIKKVLAYSTVSQLGYMFLAVGSGAYVAGIFHLATHAFFKALLFLGAGSVIHAMHHAYHATHSTEDAQDMRNMGGLRRHMPWTFGLMAIATLAIAGVPGLSGFFSKDEILALAFGRGEAAPVWFVFWGMGALAALLTAFYMARLMAMTFFGENRTGAPEQAHLHEAPWIMTGPLVVLGVLSLIGGLLNLPSFVPGPHHLLETWLEPVMAPAERFLRLELPHGATEMLLVGLAVTIAIVGLAWGARSTLRRAILPAREASEDRGIWKLLNRKWYVDELYQEFIVDPIVRFSRGILWKVVDQSVIDRAGVNGSAWIARQLGRIGSRLQTGEVGAYIIFFVVGAIWILYSVGR